MGSLIQSSLQSNKGEVAEGDASTGGRRCLREVENGKKAPAATEGKTKNINYSY